MSNRIFTDEDIKNKDLKVYNYNLGLLKGKSTNDFKSITLSKPKHDKQLPNIGAIKRIVKNQ
jgi:hypothetical protein